MKRKAGCHISVRRIIFFAGSLASGARNFKAKNGMALNARLRSAGIFKISRFLRSRFKINAYAIMCGLEWMGGINFVASRIFQI